MRTADGRRRSISVFFPAYNDAMTIGGLVECAYRAVGRLTDDYEVIVVNDGSPDNTREVLEELRTRYPDLRVVEHPVNRGYGGALRSGFQAATKELVFYTDGDAQYDPSEMAQLAAAMNGCDIVNGYKIKRGDHWSRIVIGRVYHWFTGVVFGLPIRDVDCDFRMIRREALGKVDLTSDTGAICVEMVHKFARSGATFHEVPVHHYTRQHGASQFFKPTRLLRTFQSLVKLWWQLVVKPQFSQSPRRTRTRP